MTLPSHNWHGVLEGCDKKLGSCRADLPSASMILMGAWRSACSSPGGQNGGQQTDKVLALIMDPRARTCRSTQPYRGGSIFCHKPTCLQK